MPRRDIHRTIAIRQAEDADRAWRFHVKLCAQCSQAKRDDDTRRICAQGWPLASAEARTRVALDRYREAMRRPPVDTQIEMF